MKLPEYGVKWPVTAGVFFAAIIVLGAFAYTLVGVDLMPDFDVPIISIITVYEGAGPQEVESRITELVESTVSAVENVDEVTSLSMEGVSLVTVKFDWGIDLGIATNDIRDKLDRIRKALPDESEDPILMKFDMSMIPVVVYGITAEESWAKIDIIVNDKIIDRLKRVPGVATVSSMGGARRTVHVHLNRERLKATGITGQEIVQTLRAQNLSNPGGHIKSGITDFLIRTPEEFTSVDQINDVVIRVTPTGVIRVKDVAEVEDGFAELTEDVYMNGKRAMGMRILKQSGGNTVAVANSIGEVMPSLRTELPKDVEIMQFIDTSEFIKNTVENLKSSLLFGGVCVFLVILFFIRDIRASIIVAITIPTSLIITFLLMYLNDYTINQISMSSLVIAIGMVVDNAIVVLDNIKRYMDRGVKPAESAAWGASEMTASVVASTLTTIAIFLPIMFTSGITKIFFGQLAAIVTMALIASLISALLLTPMMCSKLLKRDGELKQPIFIKFGKILDKVETIYGNILNMALRNRIKTVSVIVLLLIGSFGLLPFVGIEYMPEEDQGRLTIKVELPTGTRFEETGKVCIQIRNLVKKLVPEVVADFISYGIGENAESMMFSSDKGSNIGEISIRLTSRNTRKKSVKDVIADIRPEIEKIPGITARFSTQGGMGSGDDFTLDVYGHDLETGVNYANDIVKAISEIKSLQDIEISQKLAQPELTIKINREKASSFGLNITTIANTVELYFSGDTTVKYREDGEEYDISVRLRKEDRVKINDLSQIYIGTPTGDQVRLSNLADIIQGVGPTQIRRSEQQRYIQITASIHESDTGTVITQAKKILNTIPVPPSFSWEFAGDEKEREESFSLLFQAGLLGMMLVYMVMASQFESLLAPLIIAFSIPFGFIGAIIMLILSGTSLSVVSLLGMLILIGIVVNNGIVLISYVNILVGRGYKTTEALIEAGKTRLRPILSTTCTTVLGMLPMAFASGDGSEIWIPIAWTVIGGLVVSTMMTLILMPTLYSLLQRWLVPADQTS